MSTPAVEGERPSGPRSRKGANSRARLIEAAKAVFEEDGFLEARITDIAERAGLSHGSFYHYFDSKEAILREVADALDERLNSPLGEEILTTATHAHPRDRIREGNRSFLELYKDEAQLMSEVEHASRMDAQLRERRTQHMRAYNDELADSVRRLQKAGLADPKLDPVLSAHAVGAMVTRFADQWMGQGVITTTFDEAVEQLTRLVANALGIPETDAPPRRKK
ncbi:MAG TPA: TetR/AcrR family transcriptional regulator [Mycobacteriales bacterium]|nr:TetR/AcrR family transcriptional regulator [Mycobacteriales bacterium]